MICRGSKKKKKTNTVIINKSYGCYKTNREYTKQILSSDPDCSVKRNFFFFNYIAYNIKIVK